MYCYAYLLQVVSVTATNASLTHVLQMEVNVHLFAYIHVCLHMTEKERWRKQIVKEMSGWHMLARNTLSD
jgi:hypothetical protein